MPAPRQPDFSAAREAFRSWVQHRLTGASDVEVSELSTPQSSGFSNETLFCELRWLHDAKPRHESVVIRVEPRGCRVFRSYDLSAQCRILEILADTEVPVPTVLWPACSDASVFGAPFYIMRRVEGRVPSDNPPYHCDGWMTELSPPQRRSIWLGGFDAMAQIHAVGIDQNGLDFLRRPQLGKTGLDQELSDYRSFLDWAAQGREQPIAEAALEWLDTNKPVEEKDGLVWGDARIGNIIFGDDMRPAAVLDWEMASVGSPEKDVGWAIFLDRHHSEGLGVDRLEGFPDYQESLDYYHDISGHKVKHLHYYQVFAGFRFSVIMMRIAQQLVEQGLFDAQQGRDFELNNTCTRLTAELLDLAPPGEAKSKGTYI